MNDDGLEDVDEPMDRGNRNPSLPTGKWGLVTWGTWLQKGES